MEICPTCGQEIILNEEFKCHVQGCPNRAIWEGQYKCKDPLFGTSTGLNQLRRVCDEHKYLLEGGK